MLGNFVSNKYQQLTVLFILGLHEERLGKLFDIYENERNKMLKKAFVIRNDLLNSDKRRCEHLQAVIYEMNKQNKKKQDVADEAATAKEDELRNEVGKQFCL